MQNLENLLLVGFGVFDHLIAAERLACDILAGGIADHAGEVADQKQGLMPQVLKLLHLVEQHRMPEMQVGRGGIEAGLDAQRPAFRQPLGQQFLGNDLGRAALDDVEGFAHRCRMIHSDVPGECRGWPGSLSEAVT